MAFEDFEEAASHLPAFMLPDVTSVKSYLLLDVGWLRLKQFDTGHSLLKVLKNTHTVCIVCVCVSKHHVNPSRIQILAWDTAAKKAWMPEGLLRWLAKLIPSIKILCGNGDDMVLPRHTAAATRQCLGPGGVPAVLLLGCVGLCWVV